MTLSSEDLVVGGEPFARTTIRFAADASVSIEDLISCLNVGGSLVTLDAALTDPRPARQITRKRALYLLAVDERQAELFEAMRSAFTAADPTLFDSPNPKGRIVEQEGVPLVRRQLFTLPAVDLPKKLLQDWEGLEEGSIVAVSTEAFPLDHAKEKLPTRDVRFFIRSLPNKEFRCDGWVAESVRLHWGPQPFAAGMLWSRDAMLMKHAAYLNERNEFAEFGEGIFERLLEEDELEEGLLDLRSPEELRAKLDSVEYGLLLLSRIFHG